MGPPEESTRHELWQAEPVDTSVLQEGDHPQARRVSETGLPVRAPGVRRWTVGRCAVKSNRQSKLSRCRALRAPRPDTITRHATCADQPHWYTFLLPGEEKMRGSLFVHVHMRRRKDSVTAGRERGHPMSSLLCFPAAEWNNRNPKKNS